MSQEDMSEACILVERTDHVTVVTLARPDTLNSLRSSEQRKLADIFDDFEADPEQWIAILTGQGERAFCAGHDLKQEVSGSDRGIGESGFGGLTRRFGRTKPVIAAVNGAALGGGFEMALACDLIVASEQAWFSLPEPRIGFAALSGGIARLIRAIGDKRTMDLVLTTRRVSAAEGKELGFVNRVVAPGDLLKEARELADSILASSPTSIQASIAAARHDAGGELSETILSAWDLPAVKAMQSSPNFVEGPRAFAERRAPQWVGPEWEGN